MCNTFSRVWINRVWLTVSSTGTMNIPLSPYVPEKFGLARRIRQSRPPPARSYLHTQGESGVRRRPSILSTAAVPTLSLSAHAYHRVHRGESTGTGPAVVLLKVPMAYQSVYGSFFIFPPPSIIGINTVTAVDICDTNIKHYLIKSIVGMYVRSCIESDSSTYPTFVEEKLCYSLAHECSYIFYLLPRGSRALFRQVFFQDATKQIKGKRKTALRPNLMGLEIQNS